MEITIKYDRKDHQIRFLQKVIDIIEKYYGEFNYVQIGFDLSKKILVFKPLKEKTRESYGLSKRKSISSIKLIKILRAISEHNGLYRYPVQWHRRMGLVVVDLKKGVQQ